MAMDQLDQAIVAAYGLIDAAEATDNPAALSYALLAYGTAYQEADPARSLTAVRRGLRVAQDNRVGANESVLAMTLCKFETDSGDPAAALNDAALAIRNYHDSGNVAVLGVPLANLAYLLDRIGLYEAAATILGRAFTPMTAATIRGIDATIAHLRDVLGSAEYDSLARNGETMSTAAIIAYAYDQIDQARAELETPR
jgi:tetratricopeptide (TPR) repeat protein